MLHKDLYVYDVVYNRETQLVKDAKALFGEKQAVGGLGMLLYQGAHAFEFWTGKKAPIEAMKKALKSALQNS
jgi:shikimate dehydrogenase